MPPISSELLVKHERPERPTSGSPEQLLHHAVRYGAYCQKLETQVGGWQAWYESLSNETLQEFDLITLAARQITLAMDLQ
ncbi:hypothetical protein [Kingella kingae]|uniref:hypothetical protein n=1 Tax=Kingella kingae TaxID=504 RepID=UPI0003F64611|nr:hypothetical protein [Kingella kingae]